MGRITALISNKEKSNFKHLVSPCIGEENNNAKVNFLKNEMKLRHPIFVY